MGELFVDEDGLYEKPEMFWLFPSTPIDKNNVPPPIDFFVKVDIKKNEKNDSVDGGVND
jgi:hypothetical protein